MRTPLNLLILAPNEVATDGRVQVQDRRAEHLLTVRKVSVGDRIAAGLLEGLRGEALVVEIQPPQITLVLTCDPNTAPTAPATSMILALPRPKMLQRVLQSVASIGVAELDLTNSWRVEKSFLRSAKLEPENLRHQLLLGCEQGMTTWLPMLRIHPRFVDMLETRQSKPTPRRLLIADPSASQYLRPTDLAHADEEITIAIGPEGGWTARELTSLLQAGGEVFKLSERILRVESATSVALGQLELIRSMSRQSHLQ